MGECFFWYWLTWVVRTKVIVVLGTGLEWGMSFPTKVVGGSRPMTAFLSMKSAH